MQASWWTRNNITRCRPDPRPRVFWWTRDFDFADIRSYPPADYAGIVVLALPDDATAAQVVKLLEAFVRREDWLAHLIGRLAIVELWRVRFRPA